MDRSLAALAAALACGLAACTPETTVRTLEAAIAVAPEELDFGDVAVPLDAIMELEVTNAGRRDLDVDASLDLGGGGVFVLGNDSRSALIPPGERQSLFVQFTPETFLEYADTLVLTSNDPDNRILPVAIRGVGVDLPMPDIDVAPQSLDFGTVAAGVASVQFFQISNEGDAPLVLDVTDQTGAGTFQLTTDPSFNTVEPGDSLPVIVTYAPVFGSGDSGRLIIHSDDPDEPTVEVVLIGNGGGDFSYPEAIIDCPGTVAPPMWVSLDGSASNDPEGFTPLTYAWSVAQEPDTSDPEGEFTNPTAPTTDLFIDTAGTWEIQLQVTNTLGTPSVPERCIIEAIPEDELHVELSWDTSGADIDLHLAQNGAGLFVVPDDCTYCNPSPAWGASGFADDPRLDIDDRGGFGPENINVREPADGTYAVRIHYFEDHGDQAVTTRVKVWTYGVLEWEGQKVLEYNEVWEPGIVNWPDGTFATNSSDPAPAPQRGCN